MLEEVWVGIGIKSPEKNKGDNNCNFVGIKEVIPRVEFIVVNMTFPKKKMEERGTGECETR